MNQQKIKKEMRLITSNNRQYSKKHNILSYWISKCRYNKSNCNNPCMIVDGVCIPLEKLVKSHKKKLFNKMITERKIINN